MNLEKYRIPLQPAPTRILDVIGKGVDHENYPEINDVTTILDTKQAPKEGVWRAEDGQALVVCNTDLPNVSPAMIDWWFGWHLPSSERYQLWHPKAHIASEVMEDRTQLPDIRARYINNESYVDEYIGSTLKKLTIQFFDPKILGLNDLEQRGATAICANTYDRFLNSKGGHLCHLVLPTDNGSQMRSGFWLGDIHHNFEWIHTVMNGIYNTSFARRKIVSDQMCLDLLLHCSEEMSHLAKILPLLHEEFSQIEQKELA